MFIEKLAAPINLLLRVGYLTALALLVPINWILDRRDKMKIIPIVALLFVIGCGTSPVSPTTVGGSSHLSARTVVSCPDSTRPTLDVGTHEGRVTVLIRPVPGISRYQVQIMRAALGDSYELKRTDVTSGEGMQDGFLLYGVSGLPAGKYHAVVRTLNDCGGLGPADQVEFSFAGDIEDDEAVVPPVIVVPPVVVPLAHFYRTDDQEGLDTHTRRGHHCDALGGVYYERYGDLTNACVGKSKMGLTRWTYLGELPYID
jgi:hypothetical protein